VCVAVALGLSLPLTASAVSFDQAGNALSEEVKFTFVPMVDNTDGYFVKEPKQYKQSPRYKRMGSLENVRNVFRPTGGIRADISFETELFLPLSMKKLNDAGAPQAVVSAGKYLYVVYNIQEKQNRGFIVRYDYSLLKKLKANTGKKGLPALRKAAKSKLSGSMSADEKKLWKAIKVGPEIPIGHGQSLAYNSKADELWMWKDEKDKSGKQKSEKSYLQQIDKDTLKVVTTIGFDIRHYPRGKAIRSHVLTFDDEGNFYFWTTPDGGILIFKGAIVNDQVSVAYAQRLSKNIGPNGQSMAYDRVGRRLYLLSDDVIASVPLDRLGSMTKDDVRYVKYATGREFEGLTFDAEGYGYLITNKGPEILKTTEALTE
jgi:hypothetical protein